ATRGHLMAYAVIILYQRVKTQSTHLRARGYAWVSLRQRVCPPRLFASLPGLNRSTQTRFIARPQLLTRLQGSAAKILCCRFVAKTSFKRPLAYRYKLPICYWRSI